MPARVFFASSPEEAGARGTVLFFHGVTASKEVQTKELAGLAGAGWLAVGLDNFGHGERLAPPWDHPDPWGEPDSGAAFVEAVARTASEVPAIVDDLVAEGWSRPDGFAVSGISMGGYIAYAAVLTEPRLKVSAPIVGSPRWWPDRPDSPHHHPDRFPPVALLSQTGSLDEVVSPRAARRFHQELLPWYRDQPERLAYVEFPESGHAPRAEDWDALWANLLAWLDRHM